MIRIDTRSPVPLGEQLVEALKFAIASGELRPGDELPSARQLGGDLGIHWNTVARAYRSLSDMGLVFVARGRKTCVRPLAGRRTATAGERRDVRRRFREVLSQAHLYGLDAEEANALFRQELEAWQER